MSIPTDLRLDPRDIEERGVLQAWVPRTIVSRIGILVSIYFLEGWRREKRQVMLQILQDYLTRSPKRGMHYRPPDEGFLLPYDEAGLPARYRNMADIGEDEHFSYHVRHIDPQERVEVSLWRMMAHCWDRDRTDRPVSGLKVHFSPGYVFDNPERFVQIIHSWCERLGAIHGSAGLGVLTEPGVEMSDEPHHYPFLMQYPALEYDAMGTYWVEAGGDGAEKPRSSNWLTILGEDNVQALGGLERIRASLLSDMDLIFYRDGIVIRAGHLPSLGAEATGGVPEAYRTVARLIKPIRFEGYRSGVIKVPDRSKRLDVTLAWIRRFD
jgi:hypothetical protein